MNVQIRPKSQKTRFYYRVVGSGPPLVFIHGILGFWRNFYSLSQAFAKNHTCLLYDQRGHGRSFHQEPYTICALVQDLKHILSELKWNRVTLIGHSLGGYVSYLFARDEAKYVEKMVIVDANPWPSPRQGSKIRGILSRLPDSFPHRETAREFFSKAVKANVCSSTIADFLMASLSKNHDGSVRFLFDRKGLLKLLSNVRRNDYSSAIELLKIPTLILRGERSKHFPRQHFKKALSLNPLVRGKEIKNCGHWIHSQQPKAFTQAVQEFLD